MKKITYLLIFLLATTNTFGNVNESLFQNDIENVNSGSTTTFDVATGDTVPVGATYLSLSADGGATPVLSTISDLGNTITLNGVIGLSNTVEYVAPSGVTVQDSFSYYYFDVNDAMLGSFTVTINVSCNAPVAGDISVSSAQVGTDVVFTISAPVGVTVTYSGDAGGTAVNGDTVTVAQSVLTSGTSSIILDSAALTSDAGCSTIIGGVGNTYTQAYCNAPTLADVSAIPSVSGADVIVTISAPAGVTVDVTSVQGNINAINGDVITFVDANLIHSIDFSVTLTATYLTADNSCNTDIDPDSVITFTVPRSRHPLAIDDVHTLAQTKSRSMRPLERGVNDSDPNGLPIRIKTINGEAVVGGVQTILVPNGAILIDDLDIMRFKSDNSFTGLIQFPYEIINTDDYEDDGVVFVTVDPLPNQPTMPTAVNDMYAMGQGTSLEVKPLSRGIDDSDPNNLELIVTSIDGVVVTGNGQTIAVTDGVIEVLDALLSEFNFTPNSSFSGSTSFTYIITNLVDDTATASVTIVVDPLSESPADPTATDDVYTMNQGTTINITPLTKGEDDSDPNDLDLSIVSINSELLTGGVQSITVTNGQVDIDINGEITFTPDVLFTDGTVMFPYIITNTINLTDSAIETITVNPVNLNAGAPTAVDDSYTMDQGETITIRPLTKGVNDSDPEDLDLSIFSIAGEEVDYNSLPQNINVELAGNVIGVVTIAIDEITFTPSATTTGTVTFPYVIKNTIDESATANQIIEVNAIASAGGPTATDDNYTMEQGEAITIRPLTKGVNDSDPNRLDLSIFSIAGEEVDYNALPQNIDVELAGNVIGVVTIDTDEIIFTPSATTTGTVTFPYVIKNTIDDSATANQIIEVNAIVSAGGPIATDDSYTMDQGETLLIRPLTKGVNDSDPGRLDISIFSIAGEEIDYNALPQTIDIELAGNVVGSVEVSLNQITFTPVASTTGTVFFPYVIKNTINESATANQTIEILPVSSNNGSGSGSDNPVAVDDSYSMNQGESRIIKPLTRHYDDNDPNGLAIVITHLGGEEVDGGAQDIQIVNATISIDANDVITFIPDPSFSGTIIFSYVIQNTNNDTATGLVNMIVDAVTTNLAAPIAIDDFYTIPVNTAKKIEPLTYGASDNDPNGESLTLAYINGEEVYGDNQIIEVPNGKLQVNNVNDITFIPNKDYLGFAMFSYEISNAIGISDTGLQTINIVESSALNTEDFILTDKDFIVYPNPSNGAISLMLNSNFTNNARITLSDVTGKTIYSSNTELKQGENNLDFNFNVSPGIMFLSITNNNQSVTKKLIFK